MWPSRHPPSRHQDPTEGNLQTKNCRLANGAAAVGTGLSPQPRPYTCRPQATVPFGLEAVGCVNGRPVDAPLSAQPSAPVTLRHGITSLVTGNPGRHGHCEAAAGRFSPLPSPGNDLRNRTATLASWQRSRDSSANGTSASIAEVMSGRRAACCRLAGPTNGSWNACLPRLEWLFSGVGAEALLVRPHGGFVGASLAAAVRDGECRSQAPRLSVA